MNKDQIRAINNNNKSMDNIKLNEFHTDIMRG